MRILLAEDNPINQRVVLRMLDNLGCDVDVVSDGHAAVASATGSNYDVVLMDMRMPGLDGIEATRAIRDVESPQHRSHIIALTANAMGADKHRCLEAGMDDYLSKPFMLDQLRRKLASCPPCKRAARDESPIDRNVMNAFVDSMGAEDHEFLHELFGDFLVDASRIRSEIHVGLDKEDAPRIRIAAHSLKANSALLGAFRLSEECERIENLAHTFCLGEIRLVLSRFEGSLNAVQTELRRLMGGPIPQLASPQAMT